eukprot:521212-Alexandrium_andersonii.AAC.1
MSLTKRKAPSTPSEKTGRGSSWLSAVRRQSSARARGRSPVARVALAQTNVGKATRVALKGQPCGIPRRFLN